MRTAIEPFFCIPQDDFFVVRFERNLEVEQTLVIRPRVDRKVRSSVRVVAPSGAIHLQVDRMTPSLAPRFYFEEFVVDDLAGFGALRPKINPIDRPVRIPERPMMRMIVVFTFGILNQSGNRASCARLRGDHRINNRREARRCRRIP